MKRRLIVWSSVMLVGVAAAVAGTWLAAPVGAPAVSSPGASAGPTDLPIASSEATPSPTPKAVASAKPSPSLKPPSAPAPRTGKPVKSNTGIVAGTKLTVVNGSQTFSTSGAVIVGKDFHGFVRVTGRNITFRNCVFRGGVASGNKALLDTEAGTNTLVENSEFVPAHPAATIDGVWANRTRIVRSNIHGSVDGVKTGSDVTVEWSYIHDMSWFASDPNQGGGPTHNDGVQGFLGSKGVFLRHNNIDMSTTKDANAALQDSASDVHVENNWLDGGGCTLNFNHVNAPLSGVYVTGNRFGRHSLYKCPILLSTQTTLNSNSGNVWDDTGAAIPVPQRHD